MRFQFWDIHGVGFQHPNLEIFRTWDPQVLETWSLHSGFPRPKKTWEILGYGFQDMVFRTWDLNFGAWIFTLAVSKIET
jgi:hypothetical protein